MSVVINVQHLPEMLAHIPSLVGFAPHDSVVLCALKGSRYVCCARIDNEWNTDIIHSLGLAFSRNEVTTVAVFVYSSDETVPLAMAHLIAALFPLVGIEVLAPVVVVEDIQAAQAHYVCHCCEPKCSRTGPVPALALINELGTPAGSREEIAATLEPGERAEAVTEAYKHLRGPAVAGDAVARLLSGTVAALSDEEVAKVAYFASRASNPYVWLPLDPSPELVAFLTELVTCLHDDVAAPALIALAAESYLAGNGAVAVMAITRASRAGELAKAGQMLDLLIQAGTHPELIQSELALALA